MKFATGLVFAALAVTAANAGNPNYLRSTTQDDSVSGSDDFDFSDSLDASGSDDCPDDCPDKYKPVKDDKGVEYPNECFMRMAQCTDAASGSFDLADFYDGSVDEDDLTIDLTDLFGSDSTDGSHMTINIMSLIGSGSDQVDLQDIIDAFKEDDSESGSADLSFLEDSDSDSGSADEKLVKVVVEDDSDSGSDDLSWLADSGSEDVIIVKGATKGKTAVEAATDSDSGSDDDLSWLDDSDSDSGSDEVLVKSGKSPATKSTKSTKATKEAALASTIGSLYEDGSDGTIGDESESDEEDPTLVKSATKGKTPVVEDESDEVLVKSGKTPATKSTKSTKATKEAALASTIGSLYEDGSDGTIGDESESDEEDPTLVKSATKGKTPVVEDDSESASDEDDFLQSEQQQGEKTATKSSKVSLW